MAAAVCIHGTTFDAFRAIQKSGLNRMKRQHIHFSSKHFKSADVSNTAKPAVAGTQPSSPDDQRDAQHKSSAHSPGPGPRDAGWRLALHWPDASSQAGIRFFISSNEVILSEGINGRSGAGPPLTNL
jgi:hypothetical protein